MQSPNFGLLSDNYFGKVVFDQHQEDWDKLADELEKLRTEALQGRKTGEHGMSRETTTFY